jgi:UDP-glucose 4-epimerase
MARVLVVGGFGFLGGRLVSHLSDLGHNVVLGTQGFRVGPKSIRDVEILKIPLDDINELVKNIKDIELVIHAAGMNSADCADNPAEAIRVNAVRTKYLASAASKAGVEKFIYISTAHVYANPLIGTISEKTPPANLHPYASSHLFAERALFRVSEKGGMKATVLRLSNAFGVPIEEGVNCWMLLINELCKQAVETHKLVLKTQGMQQRNFIGINQFCYSLEQFISIGTSFGPIGIFNVGNSKSHTILEIALLVQKRCLKVLGYEPVLQIGNVQNTSSQELIYSINKLSNLGIKFNHKDFNKEIDNLLKFCNIKFSPLNKFK